MATSGVYTFARTRNQIITAAARKVNAIEAGETPDSETITDFAEALNAMLRHWQADGIHIWRIAEATLFLQLDQTQYELSTTSSDHCTESYTETTLSAAAADGASTISVTSATGIATGYYIGVQVDDGTLHWTTVNGAPSGTTVTLTAALDDSAASGNRVLVYQTKMVRPLKVLSARRYNMDSAIDTPLRLYDRIEYREMPNKTSEATVNALFYDRRGGANASGLVHVWPEPSDLTEAVKMTVARPIQDFTASGETPDFPDEWYLALIWNLADQMADEYDVPEPKRGRIERNAAKYLADVTWNETELTDIQFYPEFR